MKKHIEEAMKFGKSYIGSDAVWGELEMSKKAVRYMRYIVKNHIDNVYTTRDDNGEWYIIYVVD